MVSWVWSHFNKCDKLTAQCNYCSKKINPKSSNTTGIIRHLKDFHSITEMNVKQQKIDSFVQNSKQNEINSNKKQKIDDLITNYVINKMVPLNTVEDKSFRELITFLEPNYKFISSLSLKDRINKLFEEKKTKIMSILENIDSISIDFDIWTSIANQSYITINCHGINNTDWKLYSINLETKLLEDSHTSGYLKDIVEEVLSNFKILYKTNFCIHDNGANMCLLSTLLGLTDIRCSAHTWDLIIKESLKVVELKDLINKCRKIVGHFKHSSTAQISLEKHQQKLVLVKSTLKQYSETRWVTLFNMFDSINNKLSLISYFDSINKGSKHEPDLALNSNEWSLIEALIKPLDSINAVFDLISGEKYSTISFIYPTVVRFLKQHLLHNESDLKPISNFKIKFKEEIERRFRPNDEQICKTPALLASALNPNLKELDFFDKRFKKLVYNEIKEQMKAIVITDNEKHSTLTTEITANNDQLSAYEKIFGKSEQKTKEMTINTEFKEYLNTSINSNTDPINWWQNNANSFPRLSELAKKYLSIAATSVTSERVFSTAGNLISNKRSALKPKLVNQLIFLNKNNF
jgi:hypothetical protein